MTDHPITSRPPVSVRYLCPRASFVGCADVLISKVTADSRRCRPGVTFAAITGNKEDGTSYVEDAVKRGANAVLTTTPLPHISVPQAIVANVRDTYARVCAGVHGDPSRSLRLVGVTGTNGKTTVTWLVRSILATAGQTCGLLGTIEYNDGIHSEPSSLTTPDAGELNRLLRRMVDAKTRYAAIEVSSHALDQERLAGTLLDVAVITNITQDHFDYHGNFENYETCKRRIVEHLGTKGTVVLNDDDPRVRKLAAPFARDVRVITCGLKPTADVYAEILEESNRGSTFLLNRGDEAIEVRTPLVGRHNVSNCLAAVAAVTPFDLSLDEIACGISNLNSVPGRLERVDCGQPFAAFVDYAHTDDALRRSVQTLQQNTSGRVICVFGAGGDRDKAKRPLLGRAASAADVLIVTSDNPRGEDPESIIDQIETGIPAGKETYIEVLREDAIRRAVDMAEPGDCVLVAGKGHETEQIIGNERRRFDDRAVVRDSIIERWTALTPVGVRQSA